MIAMMLASVATADSEGFLLYGGVANGISSAITGANMKTAIKKPVEKRFMTDPLRYLAISCRHQGKLLNSRL